MQAQKGRSIRCMYQKIDINYKYVVPTNTTTDEVYLGTTEEDIKNRCFKYKQLFKNRHHKNDTKLSKHIWEKREECCPLIGTSL